MRKEKIQAHWWRKSLTGLLLGFTLALALSGIFAWAGPGGIHEANKVQMNMWIIAPVWMLALSLVYLIDNGNRAIIYFVSLNILAYSILWTLRWWLA